MYSHDAQAVLNAFAKAYESALANYEAASALAELNHISQATSLAILSLEEVGKMFLLDGLLFAMKDDERYRQYKQGHLSHRTKLDAAELFPLFLRYLINLDPRRNENERRYKQVELLIATDLKAKRQELAAHFGRDFVFSDLDQLKQKGFYSHEAEGVAKANKEAIDPKVEKAVLALAWRVTDSLTFVLSRSLENYKAMFQNLREKVDEAKLKQVRNALAKILENEPELRSNGPDRGTS